MDWNDVSVCQCSVLQFCEPTIFPSTWILLYIYNIRNVGFGKFPLLPLATWYEVLCLLIQCRRSSVTFLQSIFSTANLGVSKIRNMKTHLKKSLKTAGFLVRNHTEPNPCESTFSAARCHGTPQGCCCPNCRQERQGLIRPVEGSC